MRDIKTQDPEHRNISPQTPGGPNNPLLFIPPANPQKNQKNKFSSPPLGCVSASTRSPPKSREGYGFKRRRLEGIGRWGERSKECSIQKPTTSSSPLPPPGVFNTFPPPPIPPSISPSPPFVLPMHKPWVTSRILSMQEQWGIYAPSTRGGSNSRCAREGEGRVSFY